MKQLNIGRSINKKKVKKMTKVIEKNVAEIIVLTLFILIMSSCQTVKEIRGNTNNLNCTHVSR
jgi:hypothetical protein